MYDFVFAFVPLQEKTFAILWRQQDFPFIPSNGILPPVAILSFPTGYDIQTGMITIIIRQLPRFLEMVLPFFSKQSTLDFAISMNILGKTKDQE